MNGTELAKVQRGDPLIIRASTFNAMIDAAIAHRRGRLGVGRTATRHAGQSVVVKIKNNSGAARSRFDVLGIDGPLFDPATYPDSYKQQVSLKGITPAADTHEGNFAILLEPLAAGGIGRAAIAGMTIVKVNVPDEAAEAYDYAEIADATTGYLAKSETGSARVVTIESGTGTKWAVVNLAANSGAGGAGTADEEWLTVEADNIAHQWAEAVPAEEISETVYTPCVPIDCLRLHKGHIWQYHAGGWYMAEDNTAMYEYTATGGTCAGNYRQIELYTHNGQPWYYKSGYYLYYSPANTAWMVSDKMWTPATSTEDWKSDTPGTGGIEDTYTKIKGAGANTEVAAN